MKAVKKLVSNGRELGYLVLSKEAGYMQLVSTKVCMENRDKISLAGNIPTYNVEIKERGTTFISWVAQNPKRGNLLLKEWDYKKNQQAGIDILSISKGSSKRVYWKCAEGHMWDCTLASRTCNNSDCPTCKKSGATSKAEQYLYNWLDYHLPNVELHKLIGDGLDVDIFIPSLKVAIEYDGEFYHRTGYDRDGSADRYKRKLAICQSNGVYLIHIVERFNYDTGALRENEVMHECFHGEWNTNMYDLIRDISELIYKVKNHIIPLKVPQDIYFTCIKNVSKVKYEKSLAYLKPEIEKMWHPTLNGGLTPAMVTPGCHDKAYFICPKCGYGTNGEWYRKISDSGYYGKGCPVCYKRMRAKGKQNSPK